MSVSQCDRTYIVITRRGDGTEYIEYPINGENYMAYPQQSYYAGVEVKVYTYAIVAIHVDTLDQKRAIAFLPSEHSTLAVNHTVLCRQIDAGGNSGKLYLTGITAKLFSPAPRHRRFISTGAVTARNI